MHMVSQTLFYPIRRCNNNGQMDTEMAVSHVVYLHLTQKRRTTPQHPLVLVLTLKALLTGLNGGYDDVHKDYSIWIIDPIRDEVLNSNCCKAN